MVNQVVFVSGNFNVIHPGHLRLLRFAKEQGGKLIVGILSDKLAGKGAHVPQELRLEALQAISWVDEAIIIQDSLKEALLKIRPDYVVKGKEFEGRANVEEEILSQIGGKLLFGSGEIFFSSLDLIKKEMSSPKVKQVNHPLDFYRRRNIKLEDLRTLTKGFDKLKVCVIGDLIIDEYISCQALGMSQEDPTIVVTPISTDKFIGGAGIVAAHAAGLGAQVTLITVAGEDNAKEFAQNKLKEFQVNLELVVDDSRPTTLKQRYRSSGKSLLRVSHLHQSAISKVLQTQVLSKLEAVMPQCHLLIFSDFNYGVLPKDLVEKIIFLGKKHNVMLAADSQSSSQIGDVGRFVSMDLLTPTEREARLATKNNEDGLVTMTEVLRKQSSAKNIILKLGEEGILIHKEEASLGGWDTDRVPALNLSPKDVAGAGDSLLITASMALAGGANIWQAAALGSIAAAIQVSRVGNTPLQESELIRELA